MKKQTKKSTDAEFIRRKAEALLKEKHSAKTGSLEKIDRIKLMYELEVHEIELEMQKEELQLAKEKAETNAEKYTNLYDYSPAGYFTINSDGEICELNFNAAKMLNKERSKLINKNFKLFITSETRSIFIDFLNRVSDTKTNQNCEVRLTINEKPSAFVHIEGILLENEKKYLLTVIDISKRKQAERELKESEERIRIFTENVPDFLLQIDSTGKINYINKTLEGLTQKDVIGSSVYSWIPEEFFEEFKGKVEKVFRSGSSEIIEYQGDGLKGEPIWFESKIGSFEKSGIITQVIIVSRDITERKKSEEELKRTNLLLEEMSRLAKVGGWEVNLDTMKPYFTSETYKIHELPEGEPPEIDGGMKYYAPEARDLILESFTNAIEKNIPYNIEVPFITAKGNNIWVKTKGRAHMENGKALKLYGTIQDVTVRKEAQLQLEATLHELTELKQKIEAENIYLKEELKLEGSFNEIIGSNKSLVKILKQVEQVAKTDTTVLILGETGTGKELIAKAIHNASDRKNKPLIKVNCSALPTELIESELFGHEKSAFTGALNRKIGRFELANGGTIFLDEIGDLPIGLQSRLLRVLQESEFERIGGEKTIRVDVRVITATNRNLDKQILENKFRQDLYYRLNVFPIACPPLRDRVDDIPSLVHHFVNKYNHKVNNKIKTVNQKTIERLMHYNWPGNIRELEHVIERAIILNQGGQLRLGKWFMDSNLDTIVSDDLKTLETVERDYIIKVLEKTNWKIRGKNGAAEILGMQPTTLESRMKKRNIRR